MIYIASIYFFIKVSLVKVRVITRIITYANIAVVQVPNKQAVYLRYMTDISQ